MGLSADEFTKMFTAMTYESYKAPLPFDPHGLKFVLKTAVITRDVATPYNIFLVTLTEGTAVVKSYAPTYLLAGKISAGTPAEHFLISPQDETKPVPGQPGAFPFGGKGNYLEVAPGSQALFDSSNFQASFFREVGKPMFKVSSDRKTIPTWGGNPHLVIRGESIEGSPDASPFKEDSLLRIEGKIVYLK